LDHVVAQVGRVLPQSWRVLLLPTPVAVIPTAKQLHHVKNSAKRWRRRMGFVLAGRRLFPHLTLRQNITLLGEVLGRPTEWIAKRTSRTSRPTHIAPDMLNRYPIQASGATPTSCDHAGTELDPPILLLDEPMGALEPRRAVRLATRP